MTTISTHKKNEQNLEKLIRTLRAMQKSSLLMIHAIDEQKFLQDVCKIIIEDCGHSLVWIGYKQNDLEKTVQPVAFSGFEENYIKSLQISWGDNKRGRGPTGTAIRTGKNSLCRNMKTDPNFEPWRKEAIERGYSSSISLPLFMEEEVFGAIMIYSREPDPFSDDEQALLTKLAHDLAYGIKAIRLNIALIQAKENLEIKVEQRTALLKKTLSDLEVERRRFQNVINLIPAYVALITPDHQIAFSNKNFEEFFGEIEGKKCYEVFFGRPKPCEICKAQKVLSNGLPYQWEAVCKNERTYQISDYAFADTDEGSLILEIGVDITDKKNIENFILSKVLETEEKDRKRFAIDLHDDLGPTLSAIKIQLSLLEKVKTSRERKELLDICDQLLSESIDKMRTVANNIMPNLIESYGLETAIKPFIHRIEKTCQIKFNFKSNLEGYRFDRDTEIHLYRILTELINNTIKHSGATKVFLNLNRTDKKLMIKYYDNGVGYSADNDPLTVSGIGLQNIKNRVNLVQGTIDFMNKGGKTIVTIRKPY
jgi:signal transduction histidine kinase